MRIRPLFLAVAAVLSLAALPAEGQIPFNPTDLVWSQERHPVGIESPLRATVTHRIAGLPVEADSARLVFDGWSYPMQQVDSGRWFTVVPDFRDSPGNPEVRHGDIPWDRHPCRDVDGVPAVNHWIGSAMFTTGLFDPVFLPEFSTRSPRKNDGR